MQRAARLGKRLQSSVGTNDPHDPVSRMTLLEHLRALAAGTLSSRQAVEQSLAAIDAPGGEGARVFLQVHRDAALAAADRIDADRGRGVHLATARGHSGFHQGQLRRSRRDHARRLDGARAAPAATRDAVAVARLRAAGAIIIGRTNMTEFAYSGLGINPHYGTPRNAFDRGAARIPGGSSSGAAISVTDGMAAAAHRHGHGRVVRIPSASRTPASSRPRGACRATACCRFRSTLDSAGPIARNVADCALLDAVLSPGPGRTTRGRPAQARARRAADRGPRRPPPPWPQFFSRRVHEAVRGRRAVIVDLPLREFTRAAEVESARRLRAAPRRAGGIAPGSRMGADQYDPRVHRADQAG